MPALLPLLLLAAAATSGGEPAAAPDPALSPALERAFAEPDPSRPIHALAVVVVHRGRLVGERYAAGIGPGTRLPGWSVAKTVTAMLAGILVGEGKLSRRGPLGVPGWEPPDPRAAVTLEHLLQMSSGLAWREDYYNPLLSDVLPMLFGGGRADMARFAADHRLVDPPGTRFEYSSGSTLVVSGAIRRALGGDARHLAFPREALFAPVGAASALLEPDASGTFVGSSYVVATARDYARLGLLLLQDGGWEGRRILPEGWVGFMRTPALAARNAEYGAGVWLNARPTDPRGRQEMPSLPADLFYASGKDGQLVVVVPSREAVIVRLGTTALDGRWHREGFLADVLAALPK